MDDQIKPAHECERCGCDVLTKHTDPSDGDGFLVCARCLFVQGEQLDTLDRMIGHLWAVHEQTGNPRPEDIHAFSQAGMEPPETYEPTEPSPMEMDDFVEQANRIWEAMDYPMDPTEGGELVGDEGDCIDGQMSADGADGDPYGL